jgi:tetratricopeptide (TPR) repeat protein
MKRSRESNRGHKGLVRFAVGVSWLILCAGAVFAEQTKEGLPTPTVNVRPLQEGVSLRRARELRRQGALSLAEGLILSEQPDPGSPQWYAWEHELWEVLGQQQRWRSLIVRLEHTLPLLSAGRARNARLLLATTFTEVGEYVSARHVLRQLLLEAAGDPNQSIQARRILIENYLADGRVDDAYVASIRFQFEFYPDDTEWKLLRAKILLLHDEPTLAALELADLQGGQVQLLLSIARLREGATSPELTMGEMTQLKQETQDDTQLERLRLGIIAEAARLAGDLERRVGALESLLAHGETSLGVLGAVSIGNLLDAYGLLALEVANREHLLVGDTASWLRFAQDVSFDHGSVARAIYAHIVSSTDDSEALVKLVRSLAKNGLEPIVIMFYNQNHFGSADAILTDDVAIRMAAFSLRANRFDLAAIFNASIRSPPGGMSELEWLMRRARTEVFAGNASVGTGILVDHLRLKKEIDSEPLDRVMQVAFDLQVIDRHDLALELFEALAAHDLTAGQRRELLFWMAESHAGEGHAAKAAELYLRSAEGQGQDHDSWGLSARFQAANAMTEGGFYDDARMTYSRLLRVTENEKRRLQIGQRLQQLKLLQAVDKR